MSTPDHAAGSASSSNAAAQPPETAAATSTCSSHGQYLSSGRKLNVIVVGGSLGGLFAGLALLRLGHAVTILERTPLAALADQGAGIAARPQTLQFVARYDRTRTDIYTHGSSRQWLDAQGNVVHSENVSGKGTSWDSLYRMLRANYDGASIDGLISAPGSAATVVDEHMEDGSRAFGRYEFGCNVTGVERLNGTVSTSAGASTAPSTDPAVKVVYTDIEGNQRESAADLVIGADGPASTIRSLFLPQLKREYVGYVAWRGCLPESEATQATRDTLVGKVTFHHPDYMQLVIYAIPGRNGSTKPGERLINWVWYCNYPEGSPELDQLMTDVDGRRRRMTMPIGKLNPKVWECQRELAQTLLPPALWQMVERTGQPFIQCVTDVITSKVSFLDGRVLLVGDAVTGLRPHPAASTSRAATDVMKLVDVTQGRLSLEQWEIETLQDARQFYELGKNLGQKSQFMLRSTEEHTKRNFEALKAV